MGREIVISLIFYWGSTIKSGRRGGWQIVLEGGGNLLFAILPPLPLLGWQIVIFSPSTTICHPRGDRSGRIERWQIVAAQ